MDKSAMKGQELNGSDDMDAKRSGNDLLRERCSCKEEEKWRCVVLNFFKRLRLNASEVEGIIARSKMIDDTEDSKLCDMFTLLKGLELHGGAPTRKPPTTWQEVDAQIGYCPTLAADSLLDEVKFSRCTSVSIEGYNILYPIHIVKERLRTHFLGCGEICDVVIPFDRGACQISDRCGVIYFWEQGAEQKALALNGTDVGQWNLIVKPLPKKVCELSTDQVAAALKDLHFEDSRHAFLCVSGYDTRLPLDDVKSALFNLLSPCGYMTYMDIDKTYNGSKHLRSPCIVSMWGDSTLDKALALNGTDMGGWNVVVETPQKMEGREERRSRVTNVGWSGPPLHLRNKLRGWGGVILEVNGVPTDISPRSDRRKNRKRKRLIASADRRKNQKRKRLIAAKKKAQEDVKSNL